MKTYSELQNAICAFTRRDAGEYVVNGYDVLLRAVNNAKDYCQRAIQFHRAYVLADLDCRGSQQVESLSRARLMGGSEQVTLRSVELAALKDENGAFWPVEVWSYPTWHANLSRSDRIVPSMDKQIIVISGDEVFEYPTRQSAFTLRLRGPRWLPDFDKKTARGTTTTETTNNLVDSTANFVSMGVRIGDVVQQGLSSALVTGVTATALTLTAHIFASGQAYTVRYFDTNQTNFLVEHCFDYLMFRSIFELNFFLKEDERVALSSQVLTDTWQNVVAWNATVNQNFNTDARLD